MTERMSQLLELYRTFPKLQLPEDEEILDLDAAQMAYVQSELITEEERPDDYDVIQPILFSDAFWVGTVCVAMPTMQSRQFFMEQLIIHKYVLHRAFLPIHEKEDRWVPCDVDHATKKIYGSTAVDLIHAETISLLTLSVNAPFDLLFEDVYLLLDRPFFMNVEHRKQESGHVKLSAKERRRDVDAFETLALVNDYDPLYFEELFSVTGTALAGWYASPLLVHDVLIHSEVVDVKGDLSAEAQVVQYLNAILPAASQPYRDWLEKDALEGAYFLKHLFNFVKLTY